MAVSIRYQESAEKEIKSLRENVAKLTRQIESMKPFLCRSIKCKDRQTQMEERNSEVYLSSKELSAKFGMFTPDWLKRNGWRLPRRRVEFTGDNGKPQSTQWGYALHEIQKIVDKGMID